MKKMLCSFVVIALCAVSCLNIEEKIELKSDNSGTYTYSFDLSQMMEMMAQMGGSDEAEKIPAQMDTTINFKDFIDTVSSLTAEDKSALRGGIMNIHSNEKKNELSMVMTFPFRDLDQLTYLKKNALATLGKMKSLDKALAGEKMDLKPGAEDDVTGGSGMDQMGMGTGSFPGSDMLSNAYAFSAKKNSLSNTFTGNASATALSDSAAMSMQMMSMMMGEFNYKTTIILPQPVKTYTGNKATLSADKKTITFSNTMSNLMQKPESGAFSVEY